jgi:hypothetical protein
MIQEYDISIHNNGSKKFFKTITFEGKNREEYLNKLESFMATEFPGLPSINDKVQGKEYWTAHGNICNI